MASAREERTWSTERDRWTRMRSVEQARIRVSDRHQLHWDTQRLEREGERVLGVLLL